MVQFQRSLLRRDDKQRGLQEKTGVKYYKYKVNTKSISFLLLLSGALLSFRLILVIPTKEGSLDCTEMMNRNEKTIIYCGNLCISPATPSQIIICNFFLITRLVYFSCSCYLAFGINENLPGLSLFINHKLYFYFTAFKSIPAYRENGKWWLYPNRYH